MGGDVSGLLKVSESGRCVEASGATRTAVAVRADARKLLDLSATLEKALVLRVQGATRRRKEQLKERQEWKAGTQCINSNISRTRVIHSHALDQAIASTAYDLESWCCINGSL
jgi:hypothetical protein